MRKPISIYNNPHDRISLFARNISLVIIKSLGFIYSQCYKSKKQILHLKQNYKKKQNQLLLHLKAITGFFYKKMFRFPTTIILRHRKENVKKCSLRGIEIREDCKFFTYPTQSLPDLSSYVLLTLDAPCLSLKDASYGLFLIDATWRYAQTIFKNLPKPHRFISRSLPSHFQTAYPRKQNGCLDPQRGLASIEALFLAYYILGRDLQGILDFYYWKNLFMKKNQLYGLSI